MWKNEIIADFRDQSNILLCEDELTRKAYLDTLFKAHTFYFDDFSNFEPFTKSIHHRVFLDEPSLIPLRYTGRNLKKVQKVLASLYNNVMEEYEIKTDPWYFISK